MKVRIDIDTRTFVRFWLVVIGFALAALAVYSARTALIILAAALFLALALNPPVNRIAKRLPGKSRVGGTALAYVAVLIVIGFIVFLVIPPIVDQTTKFAQTIPALVNGASKQYKVVNDVVNHYHLQSQLDQFTTSIKNSAATFASGVGKSLISGIGSLFTIVTSTILILVLAFLMLVEGPDWQKKIWGIYNDKVRMKHHRDVVHKMYHVVTGYVIGQLSISAIDGLTAGIGVFVLSFIFPGIAHNLAIPTAAIVFIFSLIPLFGATIGGLIVTAILALNNLPSAGIFILFFVLYQQVESNFIVPRIQSKRLDLSALAILTAVTIGIYLFGIAGGIISIPIAGCIRVLIEDHLEHKKNASDDETDDLASEDVAVFKKEA
jgi:predicted PurR-regulated permease PerM